MPKYNDDEVIARALQEEYDREMNDQRRNNQSSSRRAPPPPPEPTASAPSEAAIHGRRGTETDEEYARRIAQEEERLYQFYQQRRSGSERNSNNSTRGAPPPPLTDTTTSRTAREDHPGANNFSAVEATSTGSLFEVKRSNSDITPATSREGSSLYEDEEYARRIEQEIHDEELARRMQESDENRASRYMAREVALAPAPRYTFKCFCSWLISFTIIAAGIIAFAYFFYIQDNGSPRNWIWDPSEFADEDPFDAKGPEDITPWRSNGKGLTLEVLNALDPGWNEFFYRAVLDWDTGYPDSLTLSTATSDPDPKCSEIAGKVKVCNGNYGATSWKGINEVHIDGSGYIYASTARLNDYYFGGGSNKGSMQYTMCHELGHAWGLPHTDEIFGNKDLGNCMDYTHNEDENKSPDSSNYDFLFRLYGLVPGAEPYDAPTAAPTYAPLPTFAPVGQLGDGESEQLPPENGNRSLEVVDEEEMQASLADARKRILSGKRNGVRTLYRSSHGEIHETDMANGHILRVHKLLAPRNDLQP